jgi:penicillin-binding protein 1A
MTSSRWLLPILAGFTLLLLPVILLGLSVMLTYPSLPSLEALTNYQPKVPLRIYSAEGTLIGEFGKERRAVVNIGDVPDVMRKAILAAEDDGFYEHGGVDYMGVVRAAVSNLTAGGVRQGASTITMQVAKNFFLSRKKRYLRKFNEVLLAFKIEQNLSKDEILQLYINHIFLGQHAYGFAAAAKVYFGKNLQQLTTAEAAMLAGLPKAPSAYNPVVNPKRAKLRQQYVLRRMHELGFINTKEFKRAQTQPIITKRGGQKFAVKAEYLIEMVRRKMYAKYGEDAYGKGLKVYTTIRDQDQQAAYQALRNGVMAYDHRHGYRGPEGFVDLSGQQLTDKQMKNALRSYRDNDDLIPAIVLAASKKRIRAYKKGGKIIELNKAAISFVQDSLGKRVASKKRIRIGSVIRIKKDEKGTWQISQLPEVESAFVSANPQNGAIRALVGGFDFNRNQFNHVTQAWRQPGSSIKPFIYSAALEKGMTPATVINDAPLYFDAEQTGNEAWEPRNYGGKFDGPMRMREALTRSRNLVSVRILQAITPQYGQDYLTKFGFDAEKHPPYLTMALGAGSVTPMQLLGGYSTFANGGFHVEPYFIERIEDGNGKLISQANPAVANKDAPRIIDIRNAFSMVSMMQDVVKYGTGRRALSLDRSDLAGKTGTTNDAVDAWFSGFQPTVVAIAWLGFDQPRSLGKRETGGGAAIPIWVDYMKEVLKDVPEAAYTMPTNMVATRINNDGYRDDNGELIEYFYRENLPSEQLPTFFIDNPDWLPETAVDQLF